MSRISATLFWLSFTGHLRNRLIGGTYPSCPFGKKRGAGSWYTIYHHLPVVEGVSSNPSINRPTNGKRTSRVPTIHEAYFLGLNFREYPQKIWPEIYLHFRILKCPVSWFSIITYYNPHEPGQIIIIH